MTARPDIAGEIWARCIAQEPPLDLSTDEDRLRLDKALRRELAGIEEELREHVAEIIRARRRHAFWADGSEADPRDLAERVAAIEAYLGLSPRLSRIDAHGSREITSLRPKRRGGHAAD